MPVAEGIDHEDINRAGHPAEICPRRGEHMPWIHIEETSEKVDAVCRYQSYQDDTTSAGAEERPQECGRAIVEVEVQGTTQESIGHQVE